MLNRNQVKRIAEIALIDAETVFNEGALSIKAEEMFNQIGYTYNLDGLEYNQTKEIYCALFDFELSLMIDNREEKR